MRSKNASDVDVLEFPIPTAEDLAALERAEKLNTMTSAEFLEFLRAFAATDPAPFRRYNTDDDEPFTL